MRQSNIAIAVGISFLMSTFVFGDYLSNKFSNVQNGSDNRIGENTKKHKLDENITEKQKMDLVLLSFEREEEERERLLKEAKRKKQEEERLRREKVAKEADKKEKENSGFPSLAEQMKAFNAEDAPKKVVATVYYGTLCRGNGCYLLGEHKLYKEGDILNNKKIMEITPDFVRFSDNSKEWFTR